MVKSPKTKPNVSRSLRAEELKRLVVQPLARRLNRQTKQIGQWLEGFLLTITTDRHIGSRAILDRIDELQQSVERVAGEIERRPDKE
jgi:hypothetical protein